jgi:hypothetical protein
MQETRGYRNQGALGGCNQANPGEQAIPDSIQIKRVNQIDSPLFARSTMSICLWTDLAWALTVTQPASTIIARIAFLRTPSDRGQLHASLSQSERSVSALGFPVSIPHPRAASDVIRYSGWTDVRASASSRRPP